MFLQANSQFTIEAIPMQNGKCAPTSAWLALPPRVPPPQQAQGPRSTFQGQQNGNNRNPLSAPNPLLPCEPRAHWNWLSLAQVPLPFAAPPAPQASRGRLPHPPPPPL
eukprot:CAMPEP_0194707788 /NCGR_PEP_ID=MMETSP0296-20130528/759_1 /TAXON_ID=39354 /ORGANISM="Heterosigma akashiwo, Strain CCMP2393" /LENGTH=107 /DNA_ID=CAMNT_0039604255 /DNA_START=85 /DNA_END=404 /DNA_ORIENTATION=+